MRQIFGLEKIVQQYPHRLSAAKLAEMLQEDLQHCHCAIYGSPAQDATVLLAQLSVLPDSINYDSYDQRLDLIVAGAIRRADCPPLTYILQGRLLSVSGRCSMIAKVCGVDLYLQRSYSGVVGDITRQKFAFDIKQLLKMPGAAGG